MIQNGCTRWRYIVISSPSVRFMKPSTQSSVVYYDSKLTLAPQPAPSQSQATAAIYFCRLFVNATIMGQCSQALVRNWPDIECLPTMIDYILQCRKASQNLQPGPRFPRLVYFCLENRLQPLVCCFIACRTIHERVHLLFLVFQQVHTSVDVSPTNRDRAMYSLVRNIVHV